MYRGTSGLGAYLHFDSSDSEQESVHFEDRVHASVYCCEPVLTHHDDLVSDGILEPEMPSMFALLHRFTSPLIKFQRAVPRSTPSSLYIRWSSNLVQALICRPVNGKNHFSLESVSIPSLLPHQILVRNLAVAQNPTDVASFDNNAYGDSAVLGCDFCGTVEQLGEGVKRVRVGDRIAGFIWGGGGQHGTGAYATHTVADEQICFRVPEEISSEAASTLPLALTTAWLALLSTHSLSMDRKKADSRILIWGGASSVGQYAIQLARYFGFEFATTCTNRKIVEELGAKHVFNYRNSTVVQVIKDALPNIRYVFDTIGNEQSSGQASQTICEAGGLLTTVRPGKLFTGEVAIRVQATDVVVWTAFGKEINFRNLHLPRRQEDRDLACELYEKLPELLQTRAVRPNAVRVIDGGLNGVAQGFELHRTKKISGHKLVYVVES